MTTKKKNAAMRLLLLKTRKMNNEERQNKEKCMRWKEYDMCVVIKTQMNNEERQTNMMSRIFVIWLTIVMFTSMNATRSINEKS